MSIGYLEKQLGDDEQIIYVDRHHWIFAFSEMAKWIVVGVVILALVLAADFWLLPDAGWVRWGYALLVVPAVRLAWGLLAWRMNVYVVTNRRVVEVTGVVNKTVMDSSLEKLTDIVLTQRALGRILGYGDIEVLTAASTAAVNDLRQIRRPLQFKMAMLNAKEDMDEAFGING